MKLVKEHINEKFEDHSDPISDMDIGINTLIKKWLDKYDIKKYTINSDITIDVNGNVDLEGMDINNFPDYINFNIIHNGYFDIRKNKFTILRGCPKSVENGFFSCAFNLLKSLKYAPKYIAGDFDCENNQLASLRYAPKKCDNNFYCDGNKKKFSKDYILSICTLKGLYYIIN
jgi:hypothetical protein